jgi:predicted RNase H-like nuclease (RuvC/YqgF family)
MSEEYAKIQTETVIALREINQKLTERIVEMEKQLVEYQKTIQDLKSSLPTFSEASSPSNLVFTQSEIEEIEDLSKSLKSKI